MKRSEMLKIMTAQPSGGKQQLSYHTDNHAGAHVKMGVRELYLQITYDLSTLLMDSRVDIALIAIGNQPLAFE
jgi:hypothetical protein